MKRYFTRWAAGLACLVASASAHAADDFIEGLILYDAGNVEAIHDKWQACAATGNVDCISGLANLFHLGAGVDVDLDKAIVYYRIAALNKDDNALINLIELLCQSEHAIFHQEARAWAAWAQDSQTLDSTRITSFARQCETQ